MMTASDFRKWAAANGHAHGASSVRCETIAEAEAYVRDYPRDIHNVPTCGSVDVPWSGWDETGEQIRQMLREAGYRGDGRDWKREGHTAHGTKHRRLHYAAIDVYCDGAYIPLA